MVGLVGGDDRLPKVVRPVNPSMAPDHDHPLPPHDHPHTHEQVGVPTYLSAPVEGQVGVYYETDNNGDLTIWIEDGK